MKELQRPELTAKTVSKFIIHKEWDPQAKRYNDDIAVLTLESDVTFTDYIQPICLLNSDTGPTEGIVTGWKKSEVDRSQIPKKLTISMADSNEICYRNNSLLAEIASKKSFCAWQPPVGTCTGESGSAFVVKIGNKFYFKGMFSSSLISETSCSTGDFAIYMDIFRHSDFIKNPKKFNDETCGMMSFEIDYTFSQPNQFPWVVSVWKKEDSGFEYTGVGSLVSERHVVTAAFAVGSYDETTNFYFAAKPNSIQLYLGTKQYNSTDEPGSVFVNGVKRVEIHPGAMQGFISIFDIAVVTMRDAITFTTYISQVCLWNFGVSIEDQLRQNGYAVGFIDTKRQKGIKKAVSMTIDNKKNCNSIWERALKAGEASEYFCATGRGINITDFDPLYFKKNYRWYLRGLFNGPYSIPPKEKPDAGTSVVYENTGKFYDWIKEKINVY